MACYREEGLGRKNYRDQRKVEAKGEKTILGASWQRGYGTGPFVQRGQIGMVTRMMCLRKLREEGKKYSTRDGRAALPLQFV